jgi:transcription termination/antitermination protein NusA
MVLNFSITGGAEILQVAEAVAREKNLKRDSVLDALKEAIAAIGRKKYGHDQKIRAEISEKDGSIKVYRDLDIVENAEDTYKEISLVDAIKKNPAAELGGISSQELPPVDFGRVSSQTVKQVLIAKIRDAEREREFEDFKDRVGEIVTGLVVRIEKNNDIIIDFGKTETILPKDQVIPRENYRVGDRIRALVMDVRRERKGPQIFLSRVAPEFLAALFTQEVPEIYDGAVQIKAVARDPGSRAKIAVYSEDSSVDPVGSCIGPRGARVTAVYNELQGEKIDVIEWSNDLANLAVNAIGSKTRDSMVEVAKIVIDEDNNKIIAVVPDDQQSLAIGRRGQNVKLASELLGWSIDIVSESDDSTRSVDEFNRLTKLFVEALNVEEVIGQLLASEGFGSLDEIAGVELSEIASIDGFDEDLASELQRRAEEFLTNKKKAVQDKLAIAGVEKAVFDLPHITDEVVAKLADNGVKTVNDIADLARDDFKDYVPYSGLKNSQIDEMILKARESWEEEAA